VTEKEHTDCVAKRTFYKTRRRVRERNMHSSFTFNSHAHHRVPHQQQQQQQSGSGQPIYNIGAPSFNGMSHATHHHQQNNLFVNHHPFVRTYASVVSCDELGRRQRNVNNETQRNSSNTSNNNNHTSILGSLLKHFKPCTTNNLPASHNSTANHAATPTNAPKETHPHQQQQHKEFEDFTHLPLMTKCPNGGSLTFAHIFHYNQPNPVKVPIISGPYYTTTTQTPPSVESSSGSANRSRYSSIMASLFGGKPAWNQSSQQQQQQTCRSRGRRRFHNSGVNFPKNTHEKERSDIERNIHDDFCDIVADKDKIMMDNVECDMQKQQKPQQSLCVNSRIDAPAGELPFEIFSLKDFPAIAAAANSAAKCVLRRKSPTASPPAKRQEMEHSDSEDDELVVFKNEAIATTPSFTPKRITICEKVSNFVKSSPKKLFITTVPLRSCLKATPIHQRQCEDDDSFIVFASDSEDEDDDEDDDVSDGDINEETETEDDDSDIDMEEEDDEDEDEVDVGEVTKVAEEEMPQSGQQKLDSGHFERSVRHCISKLWMSVH